MVQRLAYLVNLALVKRQWLSRQRVANPQFVQLVINFQGINVSNVGLAFLVQKVQRLAHLVLQVHTARLVLHHAHLVQRVHIVELVHLYAQLVQMEPIVHLAH
jgi:hypothetical protein